jgi:hypothetical protein
MTMNKIAFCITGWHYPTDFYTQIKNIPGVDIFVISHKPIKSLPDFVLKTLPAERVLVKPNYGYDWGCFQQFLETHSWQSYDYIFFMHDDISILNLGFVDACIELLGEGYSVVGNGRPFDKRDWPRTHALYYAHASWQLPSLSFEHDVVRGSFFATRKDVLEKMGSFEVFWDRFHLNVGFGNYSLLATSGKFGAVFGEKTFAYLSEAYRTSPYIIEFERGEDTRENKSEEKKDRRYLFNHFFMPWYKKLSNAYILGTLEKERRFPGNIAQGLRKTIIHLFADL